MNAGPDVSADRGPLVTSRTAADVRLVVQEAVERTGALRLVFAMGTRLTSPK